MTTANNNILATIDGRKIRGFRFRTMRNARHLAYTGCKPMRVILGHDEEIWVVTPADAERLVRGGYEYAK